LSTYRRTRRGTAVLTIVSVVLVVLIISLFVHEESTGPEKTDGLGSNTAATSPAPTTAAPTTPAPTTLPASATSSTPRATPTHTVSSAATATLAALIAQAPAGGASVSAYNTVTGKQVTLGAAKGMLEASVSKIALLEILLLERQEQGKLLTSNEDSELTDMIEHSSNDAANDVFDLAGGHEDVVEHQAPLGLDTKITIYGPGNLWGLTTSSAAQQLVLLHNLVDDDSPLNAKSRQYALSLLQHVESDQRWGVPVAADKGSTYYVKNGWLAVDDDDDLWAVNSDGIITVHGQQLLVSAMSQHGTSFDGGIDYIEKLVKAAVALVS
jgi:hypothetical protein